MQPDLYEWIMKTWRSEFGSRIKGAELEFNLRVFPTISNLQELLKIVSLAKDFIGTRPQNDPKLDVKVSIHIGDKTLEMTKNTLSILTATDGWFKPGEKEVEEAVVRASGEKTR